MSTCPALLTIFERILKRVEDDSNDYTVIAKYISQRMEFEKTIASQLEKIIPIQHKTQNLIVKSFIDALQQEVDFHNTFSTSIQNDILVKTNQFSIQSKEQKQSIETTIKNPKKGIQNALNQSAKAINELENQKRKLDGLAGSQLEKQNKRIFDQTKKYQCAQSQEHNLVNKISGQVLPTLINSYSTFELEHLRIMKDSSLCFISLKKAMFDNIHKIDQTFSMKMNHYDISYHSNQDIKKTFNPSQEILEEEDVDRFAIAVADYVSDNPSDLSFEVGDKIKIIEENSSGWFEGELNDKKGLFPISFCILPHNQDTNRVAVDAVFLVNRDFTPMLPNELQLLMGDFVFVDFINMKDGKCSGKNLRNDKVGYFPVDFLDTKLDGSNQFHKRIVDGDLPSD